ncbi:MAG: pyridoxamine 5'-phosphate oxidase family protein [Thermoplasmata archaeon]
MVYTQPPYLTDEEMESFLKEANTARFCSLNPDGTIHAVPVSYKYEKGRILIVTPAASRKARNVKRNRNVTVLVDVSGKRISDFKGAIIYGKADVKEGTLSEMMSVGEVWMPGDKVEAWSKGLMALTKWVTISVEPERRASFDYAKDKEFVAALQG